MEKNKQISRKAFVRTGTGLALGLVAWVWYRLSGIQDIRENSMEFRHGADVPMGFSYYGKYYLYRVGSSVRAFSTTCTHAGCRIGNTTGAVLQCSCHGSQFEAKSGKPLKGPAVRNLEEFECNFDLKTEQWVVRLKSVVSKSS
ncbi:MAG: Rieske (2Fe-2S) protein [Prolixibacteraceae bacterium]|jgi:Rieske Fe-S protein